MPLFVAFAASGALADSHKAVGATIWDASAAQTAGLSSDDRAVVAMALAGDAAGEPFVIVDKRRARVFIFDAAGDLLGATPALLGSAIGDDSAPGVGSRPLSRISPAERTTPAGRFDASLGKNLRGQPMLWVDYDAAIALHSVQFTDPREHRAQRLATASLSDKRASYGCINVPGAFFDTLVTRQFSGHRGVVYVLPEVRSLQAVFSGLRSSGGDVAAGS